MTPSRTLPIVTYPNPFLRKRSLPVVSFDSSLHRLLDDMYITMLAKNGVGLAAVQTGNLIRALLVNIPDSQGVQHEEELLEIINPEFTLQEGSLEFQEGCLSVPDFFEDVTRFQKVTIRYKDRYGVDRELTAEGYLAVAIQHEIDHLNGILFIDKLPLLKRKKFEKECRRQKKLSASKS